MPQVPCWYGRIPEILSLLRTSSAPPLLDRPAVEQLFGVSRRQAIRILHLANGYQVGKTFIVEREALAQFLSKIQRTGAVREFRARKQRVVTALNEVANYVEAQRVEIRPRPKTLNQRPSDLPAAVELVSPGKLQISYVDPEDLLARIAELAAAAANDFPTFRRLYGAAK